jgi:hypothetical protein
MNAAPPAAHFEISIDGKPRTYRDPAFSAGRPAASSGPAFPPHRIGRSIDDAGLFAFFPFASRAQAGLATICRAPHRWLVSAFHRPTGARHGEAYKENLGEAEHQPHHSELEKMGERASSR